MQTEAEFRVFLKNAIMKATRPLIFFAGAGVSIDSGLPSFWSFSTHVIRCTTGYVEQGRTTARRSVLSQDDIKLLADRLRPEVLLQVLSEEFDARLFEFYEWLDCDVPNPNHEFLAHAMRAGHLVFTTNIDCLIEAAYRNLFNHEPRVCVTEDDYAEFLRQEEPIDGEHLFQPGTLLKLHGSLGSQENEAERYITIQFALNQVGQGLTPNKAWALKQCFQSTDSCFLGYSGCDHFSVQPILRNTPSQKSVYWLWFDKDQTSPRWETDTRTFLQMKQEIEERIAKGESYSKIAEDRGWEKLSVAEILSGSERAKAYRWIGDTSYLLMQIGNTNPIPPCNKEPPFPDWLIDIQDFQLHMSAARLFRRASELEKAASHCDKALHHATSEWQQARAMRVLADVLLVPSTRETDQKALETLQSALALYDQQYPEQVVETKLDIANLYRRMKEYPKALETLREIEKLLDGIPLYDARTRLASRMHLLLGLVLGLSGNRDVTNPQASLRHLSEAVEAAKQIGQVTTWSSALNSRGLVTYQAAAESVEQLTKAEQDLYEALEINTRIGDTRACFQQRRNLGLIHTKLANIEPQKREDWLEKALADYNTAQKFLLQFPGGPPLGEMMETNFRKGEVLVRMGRLRDAEEVLSDLQQKRQNSGDWHNEARTLELLLQTTDDLATLQTRIQRIAEIYSDMVRTPEKLESCRRYPIRFQNAEQILRSARQTADRRGFADLRNQLDLVEEHLREASRSS